MVPDEELNTNGRNLMNFKRAFAPVALVGLLLSVAAPTAAPAVSPMRGAPQVISGTGDSVPALAPIDEPVIITLTHDGTSNFIVKPIGKDGDEGMYWLNEIGPFNGTVFQEMDDIFAPYNKKNPIVAATVQADGNWTITINKLSSAPAKGAKSGNGAGDQVFKFAKATKGFKRITLSHEGTSNFIVYPIDSKGKTGFYLTNEIGAYSGTVRLPSGTKYIWVRADGPWSYTIK